LTVFRIVQEALSNVLKHSGSRTALVMVARDTNELTVEIADKGKGISQGCDPQGVGLGGMLERVRILQGKLTIRSNQDGTIISARLPLNSHKVLTTTAESKALIAKMVG
jgi:two-component system, NarL family, sensor histidine kinase UhpB